MKRIELFLKSRLLCLVVILACTFSISNAQNVPNRGFENWDTETLFESPKDWHNSNIEGRGTINVFKNTDAHTGMYSAHLKNKADSSFGYVLIGTTGEEGPDGGVPYTSKFDSVTGWYKCDMKPGDSAQIILFKYTSTDTVLNTFKLFGTVNGWTRFSFPVDTLSQTEVFFGVVSTDPFTQMGMNPNSWIMLDDLAFSYSGTGTPSPLPNPSFENWDKVDVFEPVSWNSMNQVSVITNDTLSVTRSTDAHSGMYAMKVKTVPSPGGRKVGWAYTGNHPSGPEGFTGGFPYNSVPTSLSGFYKYVPQGADTGMILITGTEYDEAKDSTMRAFFAAIPIIGTSRYVGFSIPIQYDTSRFHIDTLNIIIVSSRLIFDSPEKAPNGTYVLIDDLLVDSRCSHVDTLDVFAQTDTTILYAPPTKPSIQTDEAWNTYNWSTGDTTRSITVSADSSMLGITVSDTNNCFVRDSILVILDDTSSIGILKPSLAPNILIYPNPSKQKVVVKFESATNGIIRITNLNGQTVKEFEVKERNAEYDVSDLNDGMYFLNVISDSGFIVTKRMIIAKRS